LGRTPRRTPQTRRRHSCAGCGPSDPRPVGTWPASGAHRRPPWCLRSRDPGPSTRRRAPHPAQAGASRMHGADRGNVAVEDRCARASAGRRGGHSTSREAVRMASRTRSPSRPSGVPLPTVPRPECAAAPVARPGPPSRVAGSGGCARSWLHKLTAPEGEAWRTVRVPASRSTSCQRRRPTFTRSRVVSVVSSC